MEGGRGGGRGKGKKSKAAKKKAAAAAKKVPANNSNVQVVAVSTAPESAAAHEPMAKSKRKRLKKAAAAANALLKAANANVQQVKKSPTASSPKPKVAQTSTAAVRPQLVSLSSKKKKKKKRKRTASESEGNVAVASAKEEQTSEAKKSPATKKKIVVLSHSGASPTIAKTRPVQLDAEIKESSVKAVEKVLSPKKMVNKVKAKAAVVSPKEVQPVVHKKTEKKQNVVVGASKSTVVTTSPKTARLTVPLTRKSGQVNVGETPARQLTHTSKEEKSDESCSTSLMNHVTAPKKASAKESNAEKNLASASSATVNEKPSHSHAVVFAPATFSKPVETAPALASAASATPEQATTQGAVPTGATGPANAPANPSPEPDQPVPSTLAGKKPSNSSKPLSGSLKRRRSVDPASTSASSDSLQPSAKRILVSSEVGHPIAAEETGSRDKRAITPDPVPQTRIQQTTPTPQAVKVEVKPTDTSTQVERETASSKKTFSSARLPPSQKPASEVSSTIQSAGKRPLKPALDCKKSPARIQGPVKVLKSQVTIDTGTSSALGKIKGVASDFVTKAPSEGVSTSSTVEIAMDSHAYVEKMMKSELDTKKSGGNRDNPKQQAVTLPTRPQNAWGASFGMVPPSTVATAPARALSTTPLSSWFLSKGCANFVKHVYFSDDEEDDSSNSGDFTGRTPTPRMISKSSPKWRASSAKKNAFLESLTAHSNWRTWYGEVDEHNLLDPPLAHIPEELRNHEVTPLSLPEPVATDTLTKKTSDLELLETDIKREKQRGLAFSEQLLMMLQGKTVSGKQLRDEYKALLH